MDRLKESLSELHTELSSGEPLDSEAKELLKQVSEDIQKMLEKVEAPEETPPETQQEKESLLDQVLNLTEEFEESHPDLANIIGRIGSALSRIGI